MGFLNSACIWPDLFCCPGKPDPVSDFDCETLYDSAPVRSYSGYGKYSNNFKFVAQFHCNHLLKQKKFIYFSLLYTQPPSWQKKQKCRFFFLQIYYKEKLKYYMALSVSTLCYDTYI